MQMSEEMVIALGGFISEKIAEAVAPLQRRIAELETKIFELETRTKNYRYLGTWADGARYEPGNFTTHDGSLWHCNRETTNRPGRDVGAWTLVCKRGQDGRDALSVRQPTAYRPNGAQMERRS
jgi:hypothetical protein